MTVGSAEEVLDCACGLYLSDPSAWATEYTDELTRGTTSDTVARSRDAGVRLLNASWRVVRRLRVMMAVFVN
jgi:hypothetical protein